MRDETTRTTDGVSDCLAHGGTRQDYNEGGLCHILKTDPKPFYAVWAGIKVAELRTDRPYHAGDYLRLRETRYSAEQMACGAPLEYTGRIIMARVTHVQPLPTPENERLAHPWVMLSMKGITFYTLTP